MWVQIQFHLFDIQRLVMVWEEVIIFFSFAYITIYSILHSLVVFIFKFQLLFHIHVSYVRKYYVYDLVPHVLSLSCFSFVCFFRFQNFLLIFPFLVLLLHFSHTTNIVSPSLSPPLVFSLLFTNIHCFRLLTCKIHMTSLCGRIFKFVLKRRRTLIYIFSNILMCDVRILYVIEMCIEMDETHLIFNKLCVLVFRENL